MVDSTPVLPPQVTRSSKEGPSKPIGDYGLIGNRRSAALVGLDGSIDWCCLPRFDSPSVFAALLDTEKGGSFSISPVGPYTSTQRYLGDSNVLETRFSNTEATCVLVDCMPLYEADGGGPTHFEGIVRVVRCMRGAWKMRVTCTPRPDYARANVVLAAGGRNMRWKSPAGDFGLQAPSSYVRTDEHGGYLTLKAGEGAAFVFAAADSLPQGEADTSAVQDQIERTVSYWAGKAASVHYSGPWRDEVVRSYLALHLLTYQPTGAIVAAPTTSLPEEVGGVRNWDYRYTWLRDAAFTVEALMALGHNDDARSFLGWLSGVCSVYGEDIDIMYRVDGTSDLGEEQLDHLSGYRGSRPVRIGNGAAGQVQHDIYGEVVSSAHIIASSGEPITDAQWGVLRTLANLAAARWREPDSGIWEVRGGPYHFVYSKVMCWVALDRATDLARRMGHDGPEAPGWSVTAETIKEEVLVRGWSERKQAFVQHYDSDAMDASNLVLPLVGFLPWDDARVVSTVACIRRELADGPLLRRYLTEETDDGLTGGEGAFALCSFWLVQSLARMVEVEEATRLFEQLLGFGNHLGLFSEMVDPGTGAALGNFPQAFTHIGLILAATECAHRLPPPKPQDR